MQNTVLVRAGFVIFSLIVLLSAKSAYAGEKDSGIIGAESWKAQPSISLQTLTGAHATWSSATTAGDSLGLGIAFDTTGYLTWGPFTIRGIGLSALGKGREGVEGLWVGDFGFGLRLPIAPEHGPFARVGVRGYMMGNERVWLSNFEFPAGYVGYQYLAGPWLAEIAGRSGLILTGRHTLYSGDDLDYLNKRKLGQPSVEVGGHAALGYGPLRGEVEFMRVNVADSLGTPLDVWRGSACFRGGSLGVCVDHQVWRGDVRMQDRSVQELAVVYGGLSVGFWTP